MGRMLCIVVDCLSSLNCLKFHTKLVACVWISIIPVEVAAGNLHSDLMSLLNYVTGRPEIDGILIGLAWLD